jgi:hypothetical protein
MSVFRKFGLHQFAVGLAIAALFGAAVFAQEADDEADDVTEEIDEITVIAQKPGDRRRVDEEYEDPIKAQLLKDFYQMKEDQAESAWRQSAAADSSSRISWGYDPKDEYRMRNEIDLQSLPSERTQPATLFRVGFGK